jgi:hypothetical protein
MVLKFGSRGSTNMRWETVLAGYIGSIIIILAAYYFCKLAKLDRLEKYFIKIPTYMLLIGLIWLTGLLISPFSFLCSY